MAPGSGGSIYPLLSVSSGWDRAGAPAVKVEGYRPRPFGLQFGEDQYYPVPLALETDRQKSGPQESPMVDCAC